MNTMTSCRQILACVALLTGSGAVIAYPNGITGYHGNASTCGTCHSGGNFTGTPSFSGSSSVNHGSNSAYSLSISTNASAIGFNLAAYLVSSNTKLTGSFSESDGDVMISVDELTHNGASQAPTDTFSFTWMAPSTLGAYRFYYCMNLVDHAPGSVSPTADTIGDEYSCGTHNITVINNTPNAVNDNSGTHANLSVSESGLFTNVDVCSNDTDTEGDAISYVTNTALSGLTGTLTHGTGCNFSYNTSGTLEALDDTDVPDTGTFTYTIQDSYGASYQDTATVTISVIGENDAPVAVADSITVNEGSTATVLNSTASSVLTNDTDVDVETLTAAVVTNVSNGSLTLNSNGTFSYTHNGTETTTDSFTYRANDGTANSNTVTVTITITPQNDRPVATNDIGTVDEGRLVVIDLLINDTDTESDPLTIFSLGSASNGTVTDNGDGTVNYTHNGGETTSDSFTYYAHDGVFASLTFATVSITITPVNDAPNLTSTAGTTATEFTSYSYQVAVTDPDDSNNGRNLLFSLSGEPRGMAVSSTGLITWTPYVTGIFNNVVGPITVTVSDGGENGAVPDSEIFSITVSPPDADGDVVADYNDNCVNAVNADQADTDNDTIGDVCDGDPDGNGLLNTYLVFTVMQNGNGSIVFQDDGNVRVTADLAVAGSGNETYDWSQTDSAVLAVQTGLRGNELIFDPRNLPLGVYNIDVTATDDGSTTHNTVLVNVLAATAPLLTTDDTDGDGTDDVTEGYADADNDGVPNYLDDSSDREFLPTQSLNLSTTRNLQTSTGTFLALGDAAIAAGHYGAVISAADLVNFGGAYGTSTSLAVDVGYTQISEFFDFTVSGLTVGGSVRVVLPLSTGMQLGAIYRTFTPVYGWQSFVVDPNNGIASASSVGGICPAPGSSAYDLNGLNQYADCVQLTFSDGGPNDADGESNGIVRDLGVVVIPTASTTNTDTACSATLFNNCPEQGGSIGMLQPLFLLFMLPTLFAYRLHRKIK